MMCLFFRVDKTVMKKFNMKLWPLVLFLAIGPTGASAQSELDKLVESSSVPKLVAKAEINVREMEVMLKKSFGLLEKSIAGSRAAEVTARNEAITAMKAMVKIAENGFLVLQQRAVEGDRESVKREFVKIALAKSKVTELFAQVRSAGQIVNLEVSDVKRSVIYMGALPVDLTIPEQFTEIDVIPEPPVSASPYF